jgi:ElaB/YqjD/DUF883 family membrane-anchored ribosome-binding protein
MNCRFAGLVGLLGCCLLTTAAGAEERYPLLRGSITRVAGNQVFLQVADKQWQVVADERSTLRLEGRAVTLADFKKGMQVLVRYESAAGDNRMVSMRTPFAVKTLSRAMRSVLRGETASTFEKRAEYQKKLDAALQEVDERSEDLEHRAEKGGKEAQQQAAGYLKEVQEKRDLVRTRRQALQSADADKWEESRDALQEALDDLRKAYDRARLRIK